MKGLLATRVALTPFDTRSAASADHSAHLSRLGWTQRAELPWPEELVGAEHKCYERTPDQLLVIAADGVGIHLSRSTLELAGLTDFAKIGVLLHDRDQHHWGMRSGRHPDIAQISKIKELSPGGTKLAKGIRPEVWPIPPYTLSFMHLTGSQPAELSDDHFRGLTALLEPSAVRLAKTCATHQAPAECAKLIAALIPDEFPKKYSNIDLKANIDAFSSWAGLVVLDETGSDLAYFEGLELRLQFAWLRAHLVRIWAEDCLTNQREAPALLKLSEQVRPVLRKSHRIIHAGASSRDQKLFDALAHSAALAREISGAEQAIADVENILAVKQARIRGRYDKTLESLLLCLAVLQVVPLVIRTPIAQFDPVWLFPGSIALAALIWIRARHT